METLSEKIAEIIKPQADTSQIQDTEGSSKDIVRELKEQFYANKDILDFSEFKTQGIYPSSGEFQFNVESKYLKYAVGVLKHTSGGSKLTGNLIKVTLFRNQLKLSGFNQHSFSETFIPLSGQTQLPDQPIFFIFDYPTLVKITTSFDKLNLGFTYKADKQLLVLKSESTTLELQTYPEQDFTQYHVKIKEVRAVGCEFKLPVIQQALNYLQIFSRKDDNQPNFSQVEIREDSFIAGSGTNIGVYKSEYLRDNPLKLNYESMLICNKILPYFYTPKVKLFESDTYYIIRDQNVYVGFEKIQTKFPSIQSLLALKPCDNYSISREALLRTFTKLSVVCDKEAYIRFKVSGQGKQSVLKLSIKDQSGRISKDLLPVDRKTECETRVYFLPLEFLVKIVSCFKFPEICIQEARDRAVFFLETGEYFTTTSIVSPMAKK